MIGADMPPTLLRALAASSDQIESVGSTDCCDAPRVARSRPCCFPPLKRPEHVGLGGSAAPWNLAHWAVGRCDRIQDKPAETISLPLHSIAIPEEQAREQSIGDPAVGWREELLEVPGLGVSGAKSTDVYSPRLAIDWVHHVHEDLEDRGA